MTDKVKITFPGDIYFEWECLDLFIEEHIRKAAPPRIVGRLHIVISFYTHSKSHSPVSLIIIQERIIASLIKKHVIPQQGFCCLVMPEPFTTKFYLGDQNPRIEVVISRVDANND